MNDNDLIREARRFAPLRGASTSYMLRLADALEAANARVARIERLLEHVDAARAGYEALVARANQLEKGLVVLYRSHPVDVARVCDEVIDRRGGLLGRIRALAGVSAEPATEEKCGLFGCVLPKGHNTGRADIPENHVSSVSAGAVKALIADASEPFLVPDVTPRGASKAAVFHVLRDMVDAGALEHHVDGYRRPNAAASAGVGQVPADTIDASTSDPLSTASTTGRGSGSGHRSSGTAGISARGGSSDSDSPSGSSSSDESLCSVVPGRDTLADTIVMLAGLLREAWAFPEYPGPGEGLVSVEEDWAEQDKWRGAYEELDSRINAALAAVRTPEEQT